MEVHSPSFSNSNCAPHQRRQKLSRQQGQRHAVHMAMQCVTKPEAYFRAVAQCPDLIQLESPHDMFLAFAQNDVLEAAQRLANYWTLRLLVFGDEAAFTELGPEASDIEVAAMMVLPPCVDGSIPFFLDRTRIELTPTNSRWTKRRLFFHFHRVMIQSWKEAAPTISSKRTGDLLLIFRLDLDWMLQTTDRFLLKFFQLLFKCMCLAPVHLHLIAVYPEGGNNPEIVRALLRVRAATHFMHAIRVRLVDTHAGNHDEVLDSLCLFGLQASRLPTSIGGTYMLVEDLAVRAAASPRSSRAAAELVQSSAFEDANDQVDRPTAPSPVPSSGTEPQLQSADGGSEDSEQEEEGCLPILARSAAASPVHSSSHEEVLQSTSGEDNDQESCPMSASSGVGIGPEQACSTPSHQDDNDNDALSPDDTKSNDDDNNSLSVGGGEQASHSDDIGTEESTRDDGNMRRWFAHKAAYEAAQKRKALVQDQAPSYAPLGQPRTLGVILSADAATPNVPQVWNAGQQALGYFNKLPSGVPLALPGSASRPQSSAPELSMMTRVAPPPRAAEPLPATSSVLGELSSVSVVQRLLDGPSPSLAQNQQGHNAGGTKRNAGFAAATPSSRNKCCPSRTVAPMAGAKRSRQDISSSGNKNSKPNRQRRKSRGPKLSTEEIEAKVDKVIAARIKKRRERIARLKRERYWKLKRETENANEHQRHKSAICGDNK